MKKFRVSLVVVVVLLGSIILYNKVLHPQYSAADKNPQKNRIMRVGGYVVQPREIANSIIASGTLVASEDVDLHPQTSGTITYLDVKEGARVNKGTLIVKLFDDDLQAQLKKLQAQKETAQSTEQRYKQLLAINGVGQQDYDNALTTLKGILADMDNIRAQIEKTEIHAPFTGVVGLKNVSVGAYITPATTVASLQEIDPLKMDFTIPEKYASEINKDDPVRFTVAGFTNPFLARVFAVEPQIDADTRTIKVRALVKNTGAKLYPGTFANVILDLKTIENALMIPTQCIIPDLRDNKVVLSKNGAAKFVTIQTGIREDSLVQITDGLQVGDTVVETALMSLKPNMKINAVVRDERDAAGGATQVMATSGEQSGQQPNDRKQVTDRSGKNQ